MKVWKVSLLTTVVFSAFVAVLLYTSCERNPCDNVTCFNGGSCNSGICRCPIGWEGTQCETKSTARYIGVYSGYTQCDNGGYLTDSVWISQSNIAINYVDIAFKSILPEILHGYVSSSASTYQVVIPDDSSLNYLKSYTLTLQGDKELDLYSYETWDKPGDTTIHKCWFKGSLQ